MSIHCLCCLIFITFLGGFAKVKLAIHQLTGEKVLTDYIPKIVIFCKST